MKIEKSSDKRNQSQFRGIGQNSSRNQQEESATSKLPLLAIEAVGAFREI